MGLNYEKVLPLHPETASVLICIFAMGVNHHEKPAA
jgi:hypothetical protein